MSSDATAPSDTGWPSLEYETLAWDRGIPQGQISRSQLRRHQGPYQAAIAPKVAGSDPGLPSDLRASAEDAANELVRFDLEMGGEIAPFGAVLLRSESAASSQIENLTASARAIAEAEIGDLSRRNAAQIVANVRAMEAALALADEIDEDSILAMHRALMESTEPAIAGKWRTEQVWVGGSSVGPHGALFVAPHHTRVGPAIADLVEFIRRDDLQVLVHAALAHAQFETIHPFPDGNGRTGRALLHSMLRNKALVQRVTVPISAGLLADTSAYFDALSSYRAGDPSVIVREMVKASFLAVANGRELATELREIRTNWRERVVARRDSSVWRVADLLLRHPVINAQLVVEELNIAVSNVYRYIEPLERAGVLTEFTDRKRHRAWRSTEVLAALDGFAARAGRRTLP
jgi:Fic family protein